MTHNNEKKQHKMLDSILIHYQVELEHSINIPYGILDKVFNALNDENVPVKHIFPFVVALLIKKENDIANIIQKT